ncbi:MAG TPA: mannosyltransferase family protein [Candidatus Elarobacter sp.]|nr:mannosyltransferase family protein [Candidatus Elarobacter sp.]
MDHALARGFARSRSVSLVVAAGFPAVAAVAAAGLTVGFFLWYWLALRGPHGALFLNLAWIGCFLAGIAGVFAGWIGYARYFARRARIDEVTSVRYDAISWSALVILWGTLLAPTEHGAGRPSAIAIGVFVLAKLVIAARFNRTVRDVALTFLMTRLPLIAIAELATMVIGQRPGVHYAASTDPLLAVWGRWDAEHYLGIADYGYSGTEPAFFPLYPLLISVVGDFTGSHLIAGLIISNTCSFLGLLYLYKLIEHEYNRHVAQRATFYVSIFPTAIFFSAVYSESLFLFLTVASFYYARERRWLTAGVFGFFAATTRSEGVLLAAPLFIEWVIAAKEGGREFFRYWFDDIVKPLIGMALVPLGLASYMAYLWVITGDPLRFSHVQTHWGRTLAPPWTAVKNTVDKIFASHSPPTVANESLELAFTALMIVVLVIGARRLRSSYSVYMALSILVPMCTSSLLSMQRFALVLFPMFALFGLWGARPTFSNAYVAFSLPLLGLFTVLFAAWYWVA